ncbi:uncharacterized, partial [Tachysurus ichikawai]
MLPPALQPSSRIHGNCALNSSAAQRGRGQARTLEV